MIIFQIKKRFQLQLVPLSFRCSFNPLACCFDFFGQFWVKFDRKCRLNISIFYNIFVWLLEFDFKQLMISIRQKVISNELKGKDKENANEKCYSQLVFSFLFFGYLIEFWARIACVNKEHYRKQLFINYVCNAYFFLVQ